MTPWLDVHAHLQMLELSPEEALRVADGAGVSHVITIGTNPQDWPIVLDLVDRLKPKVFGTLGIHPHDAALWNEEAKTLLRQNLSHPRIVAVGEIGLDYYYDNSPREVQIEAFRAQMEIAAEFGMPVEIHTRDAEEDTFLVLKEFSGRVKGLLHCFTSSWELAEKALSLGYHISFSGVVTFKNADPLREVVRRTPLDMLHVETDAPFLAPVPHRGQKNHPALMLATAQKVAELKGISLDELAEATNQNAQRLFSKLSL